MTLTALGVKALLRKREARRYCDQHGLYLQVLPSGSGSWLFRYRRHGKTHWLGLGPEHTVSLADARLCALELRKRVLEGAHPVPKRKAPVALSFEEAAQAYIEAKRAGWRNPKHPQQWLSTLQMYAFPVIGRMHVAGITTEDVLRVVEPIWVGKTETASRVRGRIEAVLDWARVKGHRTGENPFRHASTHRVRAGAQAPS